MRVRRVIGLAVVLVLGLGVLSVARRPADAGVAPGGIPTSSWSVVGLLRARIPGAGALRDEIECPEIFFGPIPDFLGDDEFILFVDDCVDTIICCGTYILGPNGQPILTPDPVCVEDSLQALFDELPGDLDVDVQRVKVKARVRPAKGERPETIRVGFSTQILVTEPLSGDSVRARFAFNGKDGRRQV
jgi:hypothetical protein